jgi:hypothetical protein
MNTCKTCKHWKETNLHPDCQWGHCQVLLVTDIQHLGILAIHRGTEQERGQAGRRVPMTPLDFGCLHHEPKPEQPTCKPA